MPSVPLYNLNSKQSASNHSLLTETTSTHHGGQNRWLEELGDRRGQGQPTENLVYHLRSMPPHGGRCASSLEGRSSKRGGKPRGAGGLVLRDICQLAPWFVLLEVPYNALLTVIPGRPDNSAAQSARARTAQVAANVQTGTPINTTTLIGINTGYAVLASAVPANSNNAYHHLQTNHPTVMQDAPTLAAAAPIQQPGVTQAPPLPVAPAVAPNPQSLNAPIGHPQAVAPLLQLNRPASVQNEYGDPEECSREWYGRFWRRT